MDAGVAATIATKWQPGGIENILVKVELSVGGLSDEVRGNGSKTKTGLLLVHKSGTDGEAAGSSNEGALGNNGLHHAANAGTGESAEGGDEGGHFWS